MVYNKQAALEHRCNVVFYSSVNSIIHVLKALCGVLMQLYGVCFMRRCHKCKASLIKGHGASENLSDDHKRDCVCIVSMSWTAPLPWLPAPHETFSL